MLSVKDYMTLDLEARRWKYQGIKADAVRATFSESMPVYVLRLNDLIGLGLR